jgi:hypothetical protein
MAHREKMDTGATLFQRIASFLQTFDVEQVRQACPECTTPIPPREEVVNIVNQLVGRFAQLTDAELHSVSSPEVSIDCSPYLQSRP